MNCFPIVSGHHFNRVPGTAIEKSPIWSFADAFLTPDAEIRVDFDAAKRRVIFVRHPKHARFDRAIFDTCRRTRTARAAVRGDGEYARLLFASRLTVANRHGPMFFYNVEHIRSQKVRDQNSEVRTLI